jgi:predicted nucleotidyltransferase
MSHPEIIDNCKKIIIQYLIDAIGRENIVSVILYGSVARNEETYKCRDGKLYLDSDLDVIVVVKNRTVVIKLWLSIKNFSKRISEELRKNRSLSHVNLSIKTESGLLHASPNAFDLHLKVNGKVIFGKELISLMPNYGYEEYKNIPIPSLCNMIFCHMMALVRMLALSGIIEGKITVDGYNSVLKSIRKLTLFMLRAIIIKDSIPLNPYNLTEIKTKSRLIEIKNSEIFHDLLKSYDDIKSIDTKEDFCIAELERYLARVIRQFNSTIAVLTGIDYPFIALPKKLIFGHDPFIHRLQYGLQYGTYILLVNLKTGWSIGLFKLIIFTILRPEDISLRFYDLFISSSNLVKSLDDGRSTNNQLRQSWVKRYNTSLQPYSIM